MVLRSLAAAFAALSTTAQKMWVVAWPHLPPHCFVVAGTLSSYAHGLYRVWMDEYPGRGRGRGRHESVVESLCRFSRLNKTHLPPPHPPHPCNCVPRPPALGLPRSDPYRTSDYDLELTVAEARDLKDVSR